MAILTNTCERLFLDHIFGVTEWNRPTELWLGVSATAFTESDTAFAALQKEAGSSSTTVFNANSYSRIQISESNNTGVNNHMAAFSNTNAITSYKNTSGDGQIDFPQASGSGWGSIQYWAIFQSDIPANSTTEATINATAAQIPLMFGTFSSATTVASGSQFRISEGDFEITPPTQFTDNALGGDSKWAGLIGLLNGNDWTFLDNTTDTTATNWYLGISTSAYAWNEDTGSLQEVGTAAGPSYTSFGYTSRGKVIMGAAATASNTTTSANTSAIVFPECQTTAWGDITHWALYQGGTTSSGANPSVAGVSSNHQKMPLITGALTTTKTVSVGDVLRFPIGSFVIGAT